MAQVEVILKENFPSLGYVGDVVKVKSGYARNFLIPRGIAMVSASRNAKILAHRMAAILARKNKLKAAAEEIGKKLATVSLEYTLKAGDGGKLFGSVQAKEIETSLRALGYEIEKTQIKLNDSIRRPGDFTAAVKLHAEVVISVPVKVAAEVVKKASDEEAGAEKKARRSKKKAAAEGDASAEGAVEAKSAEAPASEEAPKKKSRKKSDTAEKSPKAE